MSARPPSIPSDRAPLAPGVEVTRIGLGTAPLGGLYEAVPEGRAHATVEQAWACGMRFFDTAPLYGLGDSERRLGHVLAGLPRDDVVVTTKVGRLLRADAAADPTQLQDGEPIWQGVPDLSAVLDFSYDGVLRSLEESLERLGLDRVDVVHVHDPDDHLDEALDGAFPALLRLRDEGIVKAVGAGMNQWQALSRIVSEVDVDCVLLAGRFTLLDQSARATLLPACFERGVAVIAGGVFNSGVLAAPYAPSARYDYGPADPDVLRRARRIAAVCESHSVPLAAAAIQFPLRHAAVAAVVVGARSPAEVMENAAFASVQIPDALWRELAAEALVEVDVAG